MVLQRVAVRKYWSPMVILFKNHVGISSMRLLHYTEKICTLRMPAVSGTMYSRGTGKEKSSSSACMRDGRWCVPLKAELHPTAKAARLVAGRFNCNTGLEYRVWEQGNTSNYVGEWSRVNQEEAWVQCTKVSFMSSCSLPSLHFTYVKQQNAEVVNFSSRHVSHGKHDAHLVYQGLANLCTGSLPWTQRNLHWTNMFGSFFPTNHTDTYRYETSTFYRKDLHTVHAWCDSVGLCNIDAISSPVISWEV